MRPSVVDTGDRDNERIGAFDPESDQTFKKSGLWEGAEPAMFWIKTAVVPDWHG
jgi:hypothetical protein